MANIQGATRTSFDSASASRVLTYGRTVTPDCASIPWGICSIVAWDPQENVQFAAEEECFSNTESTNFDACCPLYTIGAFACPMTYVSISIPQTPDALTSKFVYCPKDFRYKTRYICTSVATQGDFLTLYAAPTALPREFVTRTVSESMIEVRAMAIVGYESESKSETATVTVNASNPNVTVNNHFLKAIATICLLLVILFTIIQYLRRQEGEICNATQPPKQRIHEEKKKRVGKRETRGREVDYKQSDQEQKKLRKIEEEEEEEEERRERYQNEQKKRKREIRVEYEGTEAEREARHKRHPTSKRATTGDDLSRKNSREMKGGGTEEPIIRRKRRSGGTKKRLDTSEIQEISR